MSEGIRLLSEVQIHRRSVSPNQQPETLKLKPVYSSTKITARKGRGVHNSSLAVHCVKKSVLTK